MVGRGGPPRRGGGARIFSLAAMSKSRYPNHRLPAASFLSPVRVKRKPSHSPKSIMLLGEHAEGEDDAGMAAGGDCGARFSSFFFL